MAENVFKIIIEGNEEDKDVLRLNDFINLLQSIKESMSHLEHTLSRSNETGLLLQITNMSHSSPFTVVCRVVPKDKEATDISGKLVHSYISGMAYIAENREAPEHFDRILLEKLRDIGRKRRLAFSNITIENSKSKSEITENFEKNIEYILGRDVEAHGSITGMLEQINIHNPSNKYFNIYPFVGPSKVECFFPSHLTDIAISGIAKYVRVEGHVRYKCNDPLPYKINAEHIEIYPEEDNLASFNDLRGIAPDLTNGLSSVEYVRTIRTESNA